jgi:hypothetical protein
LSKYLEFLTTKHDVVPGSKWGAALFKKMCPADVCPTL